MAADGKTPNPPTGGGAGTLCVHVVSLCADTKTMTCRPCWGTHILTYQQTDRQTHRHTYINQYKHIVIPIHGCVCVSYPPFGGGGGEPGGAGSYIHIYTYKSNRTSSHSNIYQVSRGNSLPGIKQFDFFVFPEHCLVLVLPELLDHPGFEARDRRGSHLHHSDANN